MDALRRLLQVLATGLVLFSWSELVFWARLKDDDSLGEWLITWLVYALMGWAMLLLIRRYQVAGGWALVLVGAVFGWLDEGVIVQTTYGSMPWSIAWTGLAWHLPITVLFGWWWLPRALATGRPWVVALVTTGAGIGWGLWATTWWYETGSRADLAAFAWFAFATTLLTIVGSVVAAATADTPPARRPIGAWICAALLLLWFVVNTVPVAPIALVVLPVLLGLCWWGLNRHAASGPPQAVVGPPAIAPVRLLLLAPLPTAAVGTYAVLLQIGWSFPIHFVMAPLLVAGGTGAWIAGLVRCGRHHRPTHPTSVSLVERTGRTGHPHPSDPAPVQTLGRGTRAPADALP